MLGRTVGLIAASALTAQALLLPPGVASVEGELDLSSFGLSTNTQSIKLPCPECVSSAPEEKIESEDNDDAFWIQGGANSLVLNFTIGDDGTSMALNDYVLYPPSVNLVKPTIDQVASSASFVEIKGSASKQSVQISSDNIFYHEEVVSSTGDVIIHINYQLSAVDSHPVSVSGAEVTMLKDAQGNLMILSVEAVAKTESVFGTPGIWVDPEFDQADKECSAMLPAFMCKLKNAAESRVQELKASMPRVKGGCHGKKLPGHIKAHPGQFEEDRADARPSHHHGRPPKPGMRPHHGGRPGHHGPHGPHGHRGHRGHHGHHHRHMMMHKFVRGLFMVLIPVMAGITVGMTVSLIGMLVGRLVSFLWIKLVRGGRRGYASVAQEEMEIEGAEKGEKGVIVIEEFEALPRYEEAPAYEEK